MDLNYTPEQNALREEVRQWLADKVPAQPLQSFDTKEGFEQHRQWEKTLAEGNWGMVTWPVEYGGRGCDLIQWLIFEEEYYRAGAPLRVNQNGIFLLGPTLMEYGTAQQKERFINAMASGEEMWAQGWSEPGAGSDMAAIRSTAIREGEEYVINGQKIWSTRAVFADWVFCIFRTDPASSRHQGLSFIFVPLDAPGVTVRPIAQLDGLPGFAEIFFDDVRVPVANRLGEEGQGFAIAMEGLDGGRINIATCSVGTAQQALEEAAAYVQERRQFDTAIADFQATQFKLADMLTELVAARQMVRLAASKLDNRDSQASTYCAMAKRFATDVGFTVCNDALQLFGGYGYIKEYPMERHVRDTRVHQILEGTNEIMRVIISRRMLMEGALEVIK